MEAISFALRRSCHLLRKQKILQWGQKFDDHRDHFLSGLNELTLSFFAVIEMLATAFTCEVLNSVQL